MEGEVVHNTPLMVVVIVLELLVVQVEEQVNLRHTLLQLLEDQIIV